MLDPTSADTAFTVFLQTFDPASFSAAEFRLYQFYRLGVK